MCLHKKHQSTGQLKQYMRSSKTHKIDEKGYSLVKHKIPITNGISSMAASKQVKMEHIHTSSEIYGLSVQSTALFQKVENIKENQ